MCEHWLKIIQQKYSRNTQGSSLTNIFLLKKNPDFVYFLFFVSKQNFTNEKFFPIDDVDFAPRKLPLIANMNSNTITKDKMMRNISIIPLHEHYTS